MTREMGKPLREARMEAARAAADPALLGGRGVPPGRRALPAVGHRRRRVYTVHRPVGVVGLITPWNFPAAIPAWKLAPALIYGNTVVLKLAQDSPLTGLHIARALDEAGLPGGRAERRHRPRLGGRHAAGRAPGRARDLVHRLGAGRRGHPRARPGGWASASQLELGGHNPLIVMADADLGRAAEAAYAGAFWSAGQKCTATRRIYVAGRRLRRVPRARSSRASSAARSAIRPTRRPRSGRS